jgi:hypothetical protein
VANGAACARARRPKSLPEFSAVWVPVTAAIDKDMGPTVPYVVLPVPGSFEGHPGLWRSDRSSGARAFAIQMKWMPTWSPVKFWPNWHQPQSGLENVADVAVSTRMLGSLILPHPVAGAVVFRGRWGRHRAVNAKQAQRIAGPLFTQVVVPADRMLEQMLRATCRPASWFPSRAPPRARSSLH